MTTDLIVVVTGSRRGVGKGIAIALGQTGATVYVTGRSINGTESAVERNVFRSNFVGSSLARLAIDLQWSSMCCSRFPVGDGNTNWQFGDAYASEARR